MNGEGVNLIITCTEHSRQHSLVVTKATDCKSVIVANCIEDLDPLHSSESCTVSLKPFRQ